MSNTKDTPTPETAPLMHAAANESIEAMFRRGCDLERQLAEATHQVAKYAAEARSAIDENERLFTGLAEARSAIDENERLFTGLAEAKEQRDRLAEALGKIASNPGWMDEEFGFMSGHIAKGALATLDRKEDA